MRKEDDEFRLGVQHRIYNWNMRRARQMRHWSQRELAKVTGIGIGTISHIETLRQFPNASQRARIAHALALEESSCFPEWLQEFKVLSVSRAAEDQRISLTEAVHRGLISPPQVDWQDEAEDRANVHWMRPAIERSLADLKAREQAVLRLRFGLDDGIPRTSEEVGRQFDITGSRVCQIETGALRKLWHPSRSKWLKGFVRP